MSRRAMTRSPKPRRGPSPIPAPRVRRPVLLALAIAVLMIVVLTAWAVRPKAMLSARDEAREALSLGQAARAERALIRQTRLDPSDPEPWLLRLEMLRVEDRQLEAQTVGWKALAAVRGPSRRRVLRAMTLAILADPPEEIARATLARWVAADPHDLDARVAQLQRIASSPRAGDPDRASRVASLSEILAAHPDHLSAREALVLALADAGDPIRGRAVLDAWPSGSRDARYHRLKGRWNLEYEHLYPEAVASFLKALADLPHDWRTHARLARSLHNANRDSDAKRAAEIVEKLREALDPIALGKRLDTDLAALDQPSSRLDLADLCDRVGLTRLAEAWRRDASETAGPIEGRMNPIISNI